MAQLALSISHFSLSLHGWDFLSPTDSYQPSHIKRQKILLVKWNERAQRDVVSVRSWGGGWKWKEYENEKSRSLLLHTRHFYGSKSYFNSSQAQKKSQESFGIWPDVTFCATAVRVEWNCRWTLVELLLRWLLKAAKFSVHHHMDGWSSVQRVWVTAPKIPNFVKNEWSFQFTTRWSEHGQQMSFYELRHCHSFFFAVWLQTFASGQSTVESIRQAVAAAVRRLALKVFTGRAAAADG